MTAPTDAFCIVAFASLGQVQRVRRLMLDCGKFADMIRTPRCLNLKGCGFSLRVPMTLYGGILETAREAGIETRGGFIETESGYEAMP